MLGSGVTGHTVIQGLADFRPTLNCGVSFGIFAQCSVTGRHLLIALLAIVTVGVAVMAWRATTLLASVGFGLILGGALGNLSDRIFNGAVFDFLALHLGKVPLFVCNFADIAISAGVISLLAESLFAERGARDIAD